MAIKSVKAVKLAERIWKWLNGRYEGFDTETAHVAKMIERAYPLPKRKKVKK
jgi:hypothetical protein